MVRNPDLVRLGLTNPHALRSMTLRDWDLLIRQARGAAVLGRLQALLEEAAVMEEIPTAPRNYLEAARLIASSQRQVIRWEVYCICRALIDVQTEFILLKGAAYVLSELPFARGRIQSDIDILVPKSKLSAVETA